MMGSQKFLHALYGLLMAFCVTACTNLNHPSVGSWYWNQGTFGEMPKGEITMSNGKEVTKPDIKP